MRILKLVGCLATLSLCSFTAGAQGTKAGAAPPPADLEPGVNTSATEPSSAEPAAAPVAAPKSTATPPKHARSGAATSPSSASSSAAGANSNAASENANTATAPSSVAGTTNVPNAPGATASSAGTKPGRATAAAAPKTGASAGKAHDSLELDTTQITGNRELPKVLYIVPWKRSDLGDLVGKPVNSLLDEVLAPVDRDVFKRQNRYYDALKPDAAGNAGAASDPVK
ncbi:MAG TPA: hypothetical protein VGI23_08245 [Steroidobacteraceae bacterium]